MSSGYKKQFFRLFLKKSLREIPRILGVILIVAFLALGMIMGVTAIYGENIDKINVGYVFEEEDSYFSVGLKYMAKGANCNLIKYDEKRAMRALRNNEIAAILIVTNDEELESEYFNSALPINSIRFVYNDNDQTISSMFTSIVNAGITDFMVLNSTRDAVRITYSDYSRSDLNSLEDDLMDHLLKRNRYYERVTFYDSGDIPLTYYYMGNAMAVIILLSSAVVIGFSKNDDDNFIKFAKRTTVSKLDILLAKYAPTTLFFIFFSLLATTVYQLYFWGGLLISSLVGTVVSTALLLSFVFLVHEIFSDKIVSTLCCVLLSIVAMFLSGNIIPLSFLPDSIGVISEFIFTKNASRLLGQIFFFRMNTNTILLSSAYLLIIVALIAIISFVRGKVNYENG